MVEVTRTIASDADDGAYSEVGASWNNKTDEGYPAGESFAVQRDGGSSNSYWGGLRFLNVTVPAGATINSATLTVNFATMGGNDATNAVITVFADVGANRQSALGASHHPLSGWTNSTANTQINNLTTGSRAIDVTSIVQELVDLGGWSSGDNCCFSLDPEANGSDDYWGGTVSDYDADVTAVAELYIDYTEAGGGGAIAVATSIAFSTTAVLGSVEEIAASFGIAFGQAVTLSGLAALAADVQLAVAESDGPVLNGLGVLELAESIAVSMSAGIEAVGSLAGAVGFEFDDAASLIAVGDLVGSFSVQIGHAATIGGIGAIQVAESIAFGVAGTLLLDGSIEAAIELQTSVTSALTGLAALSAAESIAIGAVGDLRAIGSLSAQPMVTITPAAAATAFGELAATPALQVVLTGAVVGTTPIPIRLPASHVYRVRPRRNTFRR